MANFAGFIGIALLLLLLASPFINHFVEKGVAERTAEQHGRENAGAAVFEKQERPAWPHMHCKTPARNRTYIMLSEDRLRLRCARVQTTPETVVQSDAVVAIAEVVSVELQQDSHTIMRLESTGTSKSQGGLTRAAVGGALFGGAGAVIGAATAGSTIVTKTEGRSEVVKGPAMLVVGTTDAVLPVIKVEMQSYEQGERWLHLLRGSLALASRATQQGASA